MEVQSIGRILERISGAQRNWQRSQKAGIAVPCTDISFSAPGPTAFQRSAIRFQTASRRSQYFGYSHVTSRDHPVLALRS